MFKTTAFAPDRADLEDLILDAPENVLFCRFAAASPGPEETVDDGAHDDDHDDEDDDVEAPAG